MLLRMPPSVASATVIASSARVPPQNRPRRAGPAASAGSSGVATVAGQVGTEWPSAARNGLDRLGEVGAARAEHRPVHPQAELGGVGLDVGEHGVVRGLGHQEHGLGGRVVGEGRRAWRVERPPTAALRSRPPTPRQWLRPTPAASSRHITCCAPVPEAATTPTDPGRTTLAKPRATPPTWAVPQSGPMTSTSAAAAASLSRTSSSTETLSENSITLSPDAMASKASVTACWPGTEMTARVAPERAAAEPRVRGATSSSPPLPESPVPRSAVRASVTAASPASSPSASSARIATTRSFGPGLVGHVEAHAAQHVDVELGRHRHLGRGDARGARDGAGDLHQAHRVVVGTSAQLDVGRHAALRPVVVSP